MKRLRSPLLTRILLILGAALLLGAVVLFALTQILPPMRARRADELAQTLRTLMPKVADGVPDQRSDPTMSAVEVDGVNFCGILEIPAYGRTLPSVPTGHRPKRRSIPAVIPAVFTVAVW